MKVSDSFVGRSSKKTNGIRTIGKLSSSSSNKSNGATTPTSISEKTSKPDRKRTKLSNSTKMGSSNSKPTQKKSLSSTPSSKKNSPNGRNKSNDKSPELRPRRRASQTYFFKYQLAKNPLKAEEEDLKMALLASLQQCNSNEATDSKHKNGNNKVLTATRKEPPDEDYLKKYKPETEDFLTFICFRTTAPNYQSLRPTTTDQVTNGKDDTNSTTASNRITGNDINGFKEKRNSSNEPQNLNNNSKFSSLSNDSKNFYISNSPMSNNNNNNTIHNNNINSDQNSPNNHRRPTRQSPRLASSIRKISENESLNHNMGTSNTAYENSINYEEDMKRASIALEDMAQEINTLDDIHNELAQDSQDCISKSSTSPYKNNKHLVKGLMTREFAGAFADEETIFESISNHKL